MAETKKYFHNIDVDGNKLENFLLNPLTTIERTAVGLTLGLTDESYVCFDIDDNNPYYWDGTTWIAGGGGGGVPTTRTLTINGVTYDLSLDRTWSVGTVTSVSALTLGTTGTDLSSTVANPTTTPVITLNVPTASATNRGALSAADWTTFDSKQAGLSGTGFVKISGTTISYDNSSYYLSSNPSNYISLVALSSTATGLTYTNTTGVFSLTSGYVIPTTTEETNWNTAYTNRITSLTVTGSSGASTLISNVLNIPTYTLAGLGGIGGSGTINYHSKFTASGTIGDSLIYDNGTNIGIGTATPNASYKLHINITSGFGLLLQKNSVDNYITLLGPAPSLRMLDSLTSPTLSILWGGATAVNNYITGSVAGDQVMINNLGSFIIAANAIARGYVIDFKITTAGNTLIGSNTDSGLAKLQVTGAIQQSSVLSSLLKTDSSGVLIAASAGTDYQAPITLTTTGTSGASTFIGNTLNIPNYATSLTGYVPYTGATSNVDLGVYDITATHLIKTGGVNTQFLKADGSIDNNIYLTSADLPTTLELFATNAASTVPTYFRLVNNISSPYYNTTAVNIPTGVITTTSQFIAALVSDNNIISGNPGLFNITTVGNIRRTSGTGTAVFYFEVYKRDAAGTETFITVSSNTVAPSSAIYAEFSAIALWNDGVFLDTDRVVLKFYGTRIPSGSNPSYEFQFGGLTPVRTIAAIPTAVIPNIYLAQLADVENVAPLNNEILYYNSTSELWEHSTIAGILGYTPISLTSLSSTATGLTYTNTTGVFSLTAGYVIPTTTEETNWNTAYTNRITSLTTTGSSGAATLISNTLNIPNYTLSGLGGISGSGTTNYVAKFTGATALGNSQIFDNGTSVGIGTASPVRNLSLVSATTSAIMSFHNSAQTPASGNGFQIQYLSNDIYIVNYQTGLFAFYNNGAEAMRIATTSNNVLIGTTTDAGYKLQVSGSDAIINTIRVGLGGGGVATNTAVGYHALNANTTGSQNVAIGYLALQNNAAGVYNVGIGWQALQFANGLTGNIGIGGNSFGSISSGNSNIGIGGGAGYGITTGTGNVLIGNTVQYYGTGGDNNTAVGTDALQYNNTSGQTAFGASALKNNTSGLRGTAVGVAALLLNTLGDSNTALGWYAGYAGSITIANTTGSNNIFIGYYSIGVSATESNRTWIGNSSTATTWLGGSLLLGTTTDVASSILTVASTTKGFLPPRMTAAQKTAISTPATGLVIYQTDGSEGLYQYLSTGWAVIGGGGSGTVTSVAALTLGTTGTDLSSTVANSTTTPVITLNVPTASASNRGALSSTDWSTFNGKQNAITTGTTAQYFRGDLSLATFPTTLALSSLTAATANNIVECSDTYQQFQWSTMVCCGWSIYSNSPNLMNNGWLARTQLAAATTNKTTIAHQIYNGGIGTGTSANIALELRALNATNNYAIWVAQGWSGFGILPTSLVTLAAGTATVAPLKLTTGVALTTPEDGAIEYHSSHLYFTIGSTRYQLDQQSAGGPGITIGTTTITSGTSGRILYDNAGVVGELLTTGTGDVVLATSPTLAGTPLITTTPTTADNTHKIADTAFVQQELTANTAYFAPGTFSGLGTLVSPIDIASAGITYAKIQNVAANTFLANVTGSAATVQEVATTRIPLFSSAITGTPDSTTFLRGDGTWDVPSSGGGVSLGEINALSLGYALP